jgi:nucleoid-associated protein YgaU
MSPQNPKDLSLQPSSGPGSSPEFANVQGHVDSVPAAGRSPEFANVQGHADTVPATGGGSGGGASYTVQQGDTLSHIAQHHYGKASHWHAIFDANRDQLNDPDKIRPGQVLKLPPLEG